MAARTRSRVSIKKEEQPHKELRTRKVKPSRAAASSVQQEPSDTVSEVVVKEESNQIMDLKHQTIRNNNETRDKQNDGE